MRSEKSDGTAPDEVAIMNLGSEGEVAPLLNTSAEVNILPVFEDEASDRGEMLTAVGSSAEVDWRLMRFFGDTRGLTSTELVSLAFLSSRYVS